MWNLWSVASSQERPQDPCHPKFKNLLDEDLSGMAAMYFTLPQHRRWVRWPPWPLQLCARSSLCTVSHLCIAASPAKSFPVLGPADDPELRRGHAGEVTLLVLLLWGPGRPLTPATAAGRRLCHQRWPPSTPGLPWHGDAQVSTILLVPPCCFTARLGAGPAFIWQQSRPYP